MHIGEISKDNYMQFMKMFGGKSAPALDAMWGKSGKPDTEKYDANGKWINPYEDPSMDITGMGPSDFKIVEVSDDIRSKIINLERKDFLEGYGKSDGEELSAITRQYIKSVPPSQRKDVGWTLNRISLDEANRLHSLAKAAIPGWQAGQAFDRNLMNDLLSRDSLDMKV